MGARRPPAVQPTPSTAPGHRVHGQGAGPLDPRVPRRGRRRRSARKNLVDVRSPDEFSGKLLAPAHLPQEQAQRGGHIPTAPSTSRGPRPPTRTAPSSPTTSWRSSTPTPGFDDSQGRPSPTAASASARATPGSCCSELLGKTERQELRRLLDRVRLARRRPDREVGADHVRSTRSRAAPCAGIDLEHADRHPGPGAGTTAQPGRRRLRPAAGRDRRVHRRGGRPVPRASSGSSPPPGTWTVRALSRTGNGDTTLSPEGSGIHNVDITVSK